MRRRERRQEMYQRERLHREKVDREMSEIRFQKLAPYQASDWEVLPETNYNKFQDGTERVPFVKPLSEPYPDGPFMETRPEPLLVWNDFQERYELRDKRIISEKTKKTVFLCSPFDSDFISDFDFNLDFNLDFDCVLDAVNGSKGSTKMDKIRTVKAFGNERGDGGFYILGK